MITLYYYKNKVIAEGQTFYVPENHVLCEGTEDAVLRILISVYGWRPANPYGIRGMLRKVWRKNEVSPET